MMKKWLSLMVVAGCLAWAGTVSAEEASWMNEAAASVNLYLPGAGDFDLFEYGFGIEFQYRNWAYDPIGWALSVGAASWEANSGATDLGRIHKDFDGSATLVPVGASVLVNLLHLDDFNLLAEFGLRYVWMDAELDFTRVIPAGDEGSEEVPSTLTIDDSLMGVVALEGDYYLNDQFLLFGSLGYQHDLTRGEITTPTGNLRDNELCAFFLKLGGKLVF